MRIRPQIALLALVGVSPAFLCAQPYHAITETDIELPPGQELKHLVFPTFNSIVSGVPAGSFNGQFDTPPGYSIGGQAFNNGTHFVLYERDVDAGANSEVGLATFNSYDNLVGGLPATAGFIAMDVVPERSIRGFTYADGLFHVLAENNVNGGSGADLFMRSYTSLNALIQDSPVFAGTLQIGLDPQFTVAGLASINGTFELLLERDSDVGGGTEVAIHRFADFNNLMNGTPYASQFSMYDVAPGSSIRAFEFEPVPEPSTAVAIAAGLGLTALRKRRASRKS